MLTVPFLAMVPPSGVQAAVFEADEAPCKVLLGQSPASPPNASNLGHACSNACGRRCVSLRTP